MSKRHISLYFGSINTIASLRFILAWVYSSVLPPHIIRYSLKKRIKKYFGDDIEVFAFSSGRGALAACLKACCVSTNDKVLLSSYTCLAVPTAVIANNAIPVYCDVENLNFNVSPDRIISECKSNQIKAVVVQHTMGCASDVNLVVKHLKSEKVFVIEDCALSIGSSYNHNMLGTNGDATICSMELSKTISVGWGGILIVKNRELCERLMVEYENIKTPNWLSSTKDMLQSVICGIGYHPLVYTCIGKYIIYFFYKFNFFKISTPRTEIDGKPDKNFIARMPAAQAAFAISQWRRLEKISRHIDKNYKIIYQALKKYGFIIPNVINENDRIVSPRISFLVTNVKETISFFSERNIEIGLWFNGPLSPLPESDLFNYDINEFPNSAKIAKHVVNLPCHSRLSNNDIKHILLVIEEFILKQPWNVFQA